MKKLIFLFLIYSGVVFAQTKIKPDLSNPNATIYTHLYFLQPDTYDTSNAALTIKGLPKKDAIDKAIKIKKILDGKGLIVDFSRVPKDNNYKDTISGQDINFGKSMNRYVPFPYRMPKIYVEKIGSKWYYSKETIEGIDALYKETFPLDFSRLHNTFPQIEGKKIFGIELWKLIGLALLLVMSYLIFLVVRPIMFKILKWLQKLLLKDKNSITFDTLNGLARILTLIIIIRYIKVFLPSLELIKLNKFLFNALEIASTIYWVILILKLIDLSFMLYRHTKVTNSLLDDQLAPLLKKVIKGVVVLIGFLSILTLWGVDPKTVLAGASIGGVAIAFAAQDTVKNLLGTFVIFLDKPFRIGDWVEIDNIDGTAETVGLRSTRVRAADTSVYQIPNSKIAEVIINNKGLRKFRRYTTELGIRYDTPPELIEAFVNGIREIIADHPETRDNSYNVEFTSFDDSSLKILVNLYFKSLDWGAEQSSKHRLHISIMKFAKALGIEFAFPSSTLMIEQFPGKENSLLNYNTDHKHIAKVLDDFDVSKDNAKFKIDPNVDSTPDD